MVARIQLYGLLCLTLMALQHSCSINSALQPRGPEQAREAPTVDLGNKKGAKIALELTKAEPDAWKLPEPSPKVGRSPEVAVEPPRSESAEVELGTGGSRSLQAEARQREVLPESVLGLPEKDMASSGVHYDMVLQVRGSNTPNRSAWQYRRNREGKIVGFDFSNRGGNRILPPRRNIEKNLVFTRDFQFRFDERARQNIHLFVTDWAPSRDGQFRLSELMNSVMYFFPRNYVPAIVSAEGRSIVTLPTGEVVEFDAKTYEVSGGVFSEGPVDLNPNKAARKFPAVNYTGKGVVVRASARGNDPRLGTTATITAGSPASNCNKGMRCNRCQVPSKELWEQEGGVRFKFPTDREFDRYLVSRCGFGVLKQGADFVAVSSLKTLDK